jgi:hypothetical protein
VRQDISIPQQLVQASHAAHESGLYHSASGQTNSIIIFGTKNKEELESLLEKFRPQLDCYPFYEPYKDTGLTAFATKPITETDRHLFKQFKLWKPQ